VPSQRSGGPDDFEATIATSSPASDARLTCAASEFYRRFAHVLSGEGFDLSAQEWTDMLATWVDKYPIISTRTDGRGDRDGWKILTDRSSVTWQTVGDDLFVPTPKILKEGIGQGHATDPDQDQPDRHPHREPLRLKWLSCAATPAVISASFGRDGSDSTIADTLWA
jgi:hypothetical protein